jgi:hypothetical protein
MATSPADIQNYIDKDVAREMAKIEAQIDAAMRAANKSAYNAATGDFIFILPSAIRRRNETLQLILETYMAKGWAYIQSRNNQSPLPVGYHLYFSQTVPDPLPDPEEPLTPIEDLP